DNSYSFLLRNGLRVTPACDFVSPPLKSVCQAKPRIGHLSNRETPERRRKNSGILVQFPLQIGECPLYSGVPGPAEGDEVPHSGGGLKHIVATSVSRFTNRN